LSGSIFLKISEGLPVFVDVKAAVPHRSSGSAV